MSASKRWVSKSENVEAVTSLYRRTLKTIRQIAEELGTTYHNVQHTIRVNIPEAERQALKAVRYSASKAGDLNPMRGKTGEAHHNWKGQCKDGYGYLTCLHKGRRVFVHRLVMAQVLGLEPWDLPETMDIHHIDGNPMNNDLDNLALTTKVGHQTIHSRELDTASLALKRSTLAAAFSSMI